MTGSRFDRLGPLFKRHGHRVYPRWAKDLFSLFIARLARGSRVLDLGGGTGLLAGWAKEQRPDLEVWVADPSDGMLAQVPRGIRAVRARAEALPFEDGYFHAVAVGEALHHFDDLDRALDEISRVLVLYGTVWIYDYDPRPLAGRLVRLFERLWGEPANFVPPDRLRRIFIERGYMTGLQAEGFRYVLVAELREKASGRSSPRV